MKRLLLLAVLLLSLYPARFLAGATLWPTLDGQTHAYRILALERAIAEGAWYPRWLPDLLHGYGYPLFEFYAPLLYYVALPFRLLGATHLRALDATVALAFVAAGLGTYALARRWLDPWGSLLAAVAYVYWPYRLAVVYVRGDAPEALALALLPFTLRAFLQLGKHPTRGAAWLAALAFAAVVCTHNVTALLFAPVLAGAIVGACLVRARGHSLAKSLLPSALTFAAGLGLSAFFWLPALCGTRWLHGERLYFGDYLGSLANPLALLRPVDWCYHYYPDTGNPETTFPPGFLALTLALAGALVVLRPGLDRARRAALVFALALLTISLAGMMRPFAPALALVQIIQAPYRWLGLAGLGAAILTGATTLWLGRRLAYWRAGVAIAGSLLLVTSATARLAPSGGPAPGHLTLADLYAHEANRHSPDTTWAGEFTPRWVTADPLRFSAAGASPDPAIAGAVVEVGRWTAFDRELRVRSAAAFDLALHAAYVPGWQVTVDGEPAAAQPLGPLGLASVRVPSGEHAVRFAYGSTSIRLLATALASLAGLALALAPRSSPWSTAVGWAGSGPDRQAVRYFGALAVLLLFPVLSGRWPGQALALDAAESVRPARVSLDGKVELLGFRLEPGEVQVDTTLTVTLFWRAVAPLAEDYKVFVHLVDAERRKVAQEDSLPVQGCGHTSAWWPGEVIEDRHELRLPGDATSEEYQLEVGLYSAPTGARLGARALDPSAPVPVRDGNAVVVGPVRVR